MNVTASPPGEPPAGEPPVLPGEPLPVQLMNTVWADTGGVHDRLLDAAGLHAWLATVAPGLPGGVAEALAETRELPALLPEYRRLRDALRDLAALATGDSRPAAATGSPDVAAAVAALDRACAFAPSWSRLSWPEDGAPVRTLHSAHSAVAAALSVVAEEAARLFAGEDRKALRACQAPGCVLYFLGTHPRRAWCSAACGNRARVARHYQRHHARSGA